MRQTQQSIRACSTSSPNACAWRGPQRPQAPPAAAGRSSQSPARASSAPPQARDVWRVFSNLSFVFSPRVQPPFCYIHEIKSFCPNNVIQYKTCSRTEHGYTVVTGSFPDLCLHALCLGVHMFRKHARIVEIQRLQLPSVCILPPKDRRREAPTRFRHLDRLIQHAKSGYTKSLDPRQVPTLTVYCKKAIGRCRFLA